MAINLFVKYQKKLAKLFGFKSFIAGHTSEDYEFDGAKSIVELDDEAVDFGDYTRSGTNRYGTPTDVQDYKQTMTLANDKSVSRVVDKGDSTQQGQLKSAGRVVKKQIVKKANPMIDKNALLKWSKAAGKTIEASAAVTKSNIIDLILSMETHMDNSGVDQEERYLYIGTTYKQQIRLSTQFDNCDSIKAKMVIHGLVGKLSSFYVIAVPDAWLPTKVVALATYKESVFAPVQLKDVNLHIDPPGISGNQIDMRYIFDAFVRAALCDGVVVLVEQNYKAAAPTLTKAATTTLASATGSAIIMYTLDGSDPRYSDSAIQYGGAFANPAAGTKVRAVAYKYDTNIYNSDLLEAVAA